MPKAMEPIVDNGLRGMLNHFHRAELRVEKQRWQQNKKGQTMTKHKMTPVTDTFSYYTNYSYYLK